MRALLGPLRGDPAFPHGRGASPLEEEDIMLARLAALALALTTLAGCYVAPAPPPRPYGYYAPGYYAPAYRPYYGGWGYRRW
jgi:hypothetical protein